MLGASSPNAIIDVRAWFRRNGIVPSEWALQAGGDVPAPALPARFDRTFRGADLVRAIDEKPRGLALLIYGGDGSGRSAASSASWRGASKQGSTGTGSPMSKRP